MQTDERVENEQPRTQCGDGVCQAHDVVCEVEPQAWRRYHLNVELFEHHASGAGNPVEALADDVQCVLGRVEQHTPRPRYWKVTQAWRGRGDCDS